jgi:hypothetical protein
MWRVLVLRSSRTSRNVPEPKTFNVYPTRTNAIFIPSAMPTMPGLSVPNVAIIPSSDDIVAVNIPVDVHVLVDVDVFIDVDVLVDVDVFIDVDVLVDVRAFIDVGVLMNLLSVCRRRGRKAKRSKYGKSDRSLP